jgi:hypothetical protein
MPGHEQAESRSFIGENHPDEKITVQGRDLLPVSQCRNALLVTFF